MSRRILMVCSLIVAMSATAAANGRAPAAETIHFRVGHPDDIIVGMTFGAVISHDGGATWQWMCETAVGYAGTWDPIYQWMSTGSLFATTFNGLVVNRDGCTFVPTPLGSTFATAFASGADGALYVAMSDTSAATPDDKIYKSEGSADGMTFNAGVTPPGALLGDWYQSVATAPSDAMRLYVSSYRFVGSGSDTTKAFEVYESTDAGSSYTALPDTAISQFTPISKDSTIDLVGVSPNDPNLLFARVTFENQTPQTSIYRSADAGQNWTKVVCASLPCAAGAAGVGDFLQAFTIDSHDNVYVGSSASGTWKSTDKGVTFTHVARVNNTGGRILQCLAVDPSDNIWGCGANYGVDAMGVGETTDFSTWTTKMLFQNIQQPVACPAGTPQHDTCQAMTWCGLEVQLGITSTVIDCPLLVDAGTPGIDAAGTIAKPKGCCDAGAGPSGLALAGLVGILMWRPRRRRSRA